MPTLPAHFHIIQGDTILATLDDCKPSEMFWLACHLQPNPAFEPIQALIQQATSALDVDDINTFDAIYEQIQAMGVKLLEVATGTIYQHFILHIEGDTAELRYA